MMARHMQIMTAVLAAITLIASPAFALFGQRFDVKLISPENGEVVDLSSQVKTAIKGTEALSIELTEPKFVQIEGRIPVLLVPVRDGVSEVKIDPPSIKDATSHMMQGDLSQGVAEIVQGIEEVRSEIRAKNYDRAMTRLQSIQSRYPKVAFLEFVKASIYFLQGRKADARTAASVGLKSHPNFEEGQKFLKSLGSDQ